MGRAPCCDKANVKKGPWSPEEDLKLKEYIDKHGTGGNWISLPLKAGLRRCGKSCRLRWLNYLRPNIKHGEFSDHEDRIICTLYYNIGSRWSIIAAQLPGRTDNDIKNYWNTKLKKKLVAANYVAPLPLSSLSSSPNSELMHHPHLQYLPSPTAALCTSACYFKDPSARLLLPAAAVGCFTSSSSDNDLKYGSGDQMFHHHHADNYVAGTVNLQNYPQLNNNKDYNNSFAMLGGTTDGSCTSSDGSNSNINTKYHISHELYQIGFHDHGGVRNKLVVQDDIYIYIYIYIYICSTHLRLALALSSFVAHILGVICHLLEQEVCLVNWTTDGS
uniref:Uncharacterized protein n=1 Tax=Kalanchoe fedtschenkoi TaxID=63787 RepID=A0A7N1A9P0_KALFE